MSRVRNTLVLLFAALTTLVRSQSDIKPLMPSDLGMSEGYNKYLPDFRTDTLPFRKGDKWGFINQNNDIVLKPQFDSLFFAGRVHFIAKDSSGYYLFQHDLKSVFSEPQKLIRHMRVYETKRQRIPETNRSESVEIKTSWLEALEVINPKGEKQLYILTETKGLKPFKTLAELQHAVGYVYYHDRKEAYYHNRSRYFANNQAIKDIQILGQGDSTFIDALMSDGTRQTYKERGHCYNTDSPAFLDIRCAEYYTQIDLTSRTTIRVPRSSNISHFYHDGKRFINVSSYGNGPNYILDEKGDTVVKSYEHKLYYENDMIYYEYSSKKSSERYLAFSVFPSLKPVMNGVKRFHSGIRFTKLLDSTGLIYWVNSNGKVVYSCDSKKIESGEMDVYAYSFGSGDQGLLEVDHRQPGKRRKNLLISHTGKILLQTEEEFSVRLDGHQSPVFLEFSFRYNMLYDSSADSLIPIYNAELEFVGENRLIARYFNDSYLNDYLIDGKGKPIDTVPYLYLEARNCWGRDPFIIAKKSDQSRVYLDTNLQPLGIPLNMTILQNTTSKYPASERACDYFYEMMDKPGYTGVIDQKMKVIIPNDYQLLIEKPDCNYYAALDAKGALVYILPDGTVLVED